MRKGWKSQPLSAVASAIPEADSFVPESFSAAPHVAGDNAAFATFIPASELEQPAFVAFSSKNGLHRASSKPYRETRRSSGSKGNSIQ